MKMYVKLMTGSKFGKFKLCTTLSLLTFVTMFVCINTYAADSDIDEIHKLVSGNSLRIVNYAAESIIYFDSDGSFSHLAVQGETSQGKWRTTKDSMCATVLPQPYNPPKEFCLYLKGRKFGETWTEIDEHNGEIKRTLLNGHPPQK
tara:strand:- start:2886 stop:3323 length:438 start_codon:yes stop_codon:yes gene_type:complete